MLSMLHARVYWISMSRFLAGSVFSFGYIISKTVPYKFPREAVESWVESRTEVL